MQVIARLSHFSCGKFIYHPLDIVFMAAFRDALFELDAEDVECVCACLALKGVQEPLLYIQRNFDWSKKRMAWS